jgi:hypothetical protein
MVTLSNQFDINLTDDLLLEEVELLTVVITAANATDGRMLPHQIDALLGVDSDRSSTTRQDAASTQPAP